MMNEELAELERQSGLLTSEMIRDRLNNIELTLQDLCRRIDALEAKLPLKNSSENNISIINPTLKDFESLKR